MLFPFNLNHSLSGKLGKKKNSFYSVFTKTNSPEGNLEQKPKQSKMGPFAPTSTGTLSIHHISSFEVCQPIREHNRVMEFPLTNPTVLQ